MTPEQQRIAIAEACGWTEVHKGKWLGICGRNPSGPQLHFEMLPDYLNDLNSIHEAIQSLPNRKQFLIELSLVCNKRRLNINDDPACLVNYILNCVNATAAQRANAFLRTIGKWEET